MPSGIVNHDREAIVRLRIRGHRDQELETDAVVDTGYSGALTLPYNAIVDLQLPFKRRGTATLGDGTEVVFDVYQGTVLWEGQPRPLRIDVAEIEPLLGMSLLYGHELKIEVVEGGDVVIRELPLS